MSLVQGGNTGRDDADGRAVLEVLPELGEHHLLGAGARLPITSFAAYANSKLQTGPLARWSFLFFIGTLMMPAALTLIPNYLLTRNFPFALPDAPSFFGSDTLVWPNVRIWDTPWAVIMPIVFQAFNFLLFKGFFDTIPNSMIQAARVDGGSEFNIFRRIVLPMSMPVFAVAIWLRSAAPGTSSCGPWSSCRAGPDAGVGGDLQPDQTVHPGGCDGCQPGQRGGRRQMQQILSRRHVAGTG